MDLQRAQQILETSLLMGVDFLPVATSNTVQESPLPPDTSSSTLRANQQARLDELAKIHDNTCPHCTKATGHKQTVFGVGNPSARLMFVGEAPGSEEDRLGIPFVGAAGKKLDEIIKAMGMDREEVYIANVLKSRPPENRKPSPEEIAHCAPFLSQQIEVVEPEVLVALGGSAATYLLETQIGITKLRGSWGDFCGIPVMPTFHPAYLLRNYTNETRSQIWSDLQQVMAKLTNS
ncbi:MAG: uracil-DNA glycosylase [Phycisphaerales bacterium]|jgi:DNA polymerase|nr:uracil-DNA glycosylase [Phycisphaerales bacterium]